VASTPIMQKIPIVIPKRERNVRSLLAHSSWVAIRRLVNNIFSNLNIVQKYYAPGCRG